MPFITCKSEEGSITVNTDEIKYLKTEVTPEKKVNRVQLKGNSSFTLSDKNFVQLERALVFGANLKPDDLLKKYSITTKQYDLMELIILDGVVVKDKHGFTSNTIEDVNLIEYRKFIIGVNGVKFYES